METATVSRVESFSVIADGEDRTIEVFSLKLRTTTVHVSSLGAAINKFLSKTNDDDDNDNVVDIVAGYKSNKLFHETGNPPYFNAIVGRVSNRIAGGEFSLGGKSYPVFANSGPNALHGGKVGISHRIWDAAIVRDGTVVRFTLESPDGSEGFPGSVTISASYSLRPSFSSSGVVLQLDMVAQLITEEGTVVETPINLANHAYFNLGDSRNGVLDHTLKLNSDSYTPVDEYSIPTREVRLVEEDAVMDFRKVRILRDALKDYGVAKMGLTEDESGNNLAERDYSSLSTPYGFDHNYVVRKQPGLSVPRVASVVFGPRNLVVYSDAPGVQVYTANYLGDGQKSSSAEFCKQTYKPWDAICLETQYYPDSICSKKDISKEHKEFWAGSCPILTNSHPTYHQTMVMRLEVDHPSAETAYRGSDTEGRNYSSIEEMWNAQDLSTWYTRAKGWYEQNCDTTIDGVLGGIGHVSDKDLEGSRAFLNQLELPSVPEGKKSLACECGAGIGRVTKGLLLDIADGCDLVESSSRLLYASPDHIGNDKSNKCRFFCAELQDWKPGVNKYSVVWIQWTLCYLTDYDIVKFLRRCSEALVDGGWIVLKENTCDEEAFVVDVEDASITRSLDYWLDLVAKSGLCVKKLEWQDGFPDHIFPVPMLAIQN